MSVTMRALQNIAILTGGALAAAYALDLVTSWFGYPTTFFCGLLNPIFAITHALAVFLITIGIILWAFSFFTSPTGLLLIGGGVLLFLTPMLMPHYLGARCEGTISRLEQPTSTVDEQPKGQLIPGRRHGPLTNDTGGFAL